MVLMELVPRAQLALPAPGQWGCGASPALCALFLVHTSRLLCVRFLPPFTVLLRWTPGGTQGCAAVLAPCQMLSDV